MTKPWRDVEEISRPYLDRMWPGWTIVDRYEDNGGLRQSLKVAVPGLVIRITKDPEGDGVYFAQRVVLTGFEEVSTEGLLRILGETSARNDFESLLEWLEMHPWWGVQWTRKETFEAIRRLQDRTLDLTVPFLNAIWPHYDAVWDEVIWDDGPIVTAEPPDDLLRSATPNVANVLLRSMGYFERMLGPTPRVTIDGENIYAAGKELRLQIQCRGASEELLIKGAEPPEVPWLDISRVARSLVEYDMGPSIEFKLFYLLRYFEDFRIVCRPDKFQTFLDHLGAKERADDELRRLLIYGLP